VLFLKLERVAVVANAQNSPSHSNNGIWKNLALVILCILSVFDIAIHLIGLGWFGVSLNNCAIAVDLVVALGVLVGMVSLFLPSVRWVNFGASVFLTASLVAFLFIQTSSKYPCGEPIRIEAPWLSAILIALYLINVVSKLLRIKML
jgi:lysylphosphatidylglycerol synthetase-like protein (DUF2156 family)